VKKKKKKNEPKGRHATHKKCKDDLYVNQKSARKSQFKRASGLGNTYHVRIQPDDHWRLRRYTWRGFEAWGCQSVHEPACL
jgi:hypothetical protein